MRIILVDQARGLDAIFNIDDIAIARIMKVRRRHKSILSSAATGEKGILRSCDKHNYG
jgi:hypothetical protein